ncbi:MAG: hypothetical protein MHPSP_003414, partial [Paramarteilia canceri]
DNMEKIRILKCNLELLLMDWTEPHRQRLLSTLSALGTVDQSQILKSLPELKPEVILKFPFLDRKMFLSNFYMEKTN